MSKKKNYTRTDSMEFELLWKNHLWNEPPLQWLILFIFDWLEWLAWSIDTKMLRPKQNNIVPSDGLIMNWEEYCIMFERLCESHTWSIIPIVSSVLLWPASQFVVTDVLVLWELCIYDDLVFNNVNFFCLGKQYYMTLPNIMSLKACSCHTINIQILTYICLIKFWFNLAYPLALPLISGALPLNYSSVGQPLCTVQRHLIWFVGCKVLFLFYWCIFFDCWHQVGSDSWLCWKLCVLSS